MKRAGLEVRANRRARPLQGHGVRRGDMIRVALPNGLEFHETVVALWQLGAVPNVVSAKLPDGELGAIVQIATVEHRSTRSLGLKGSTAG